MKKTSRFLVPAAFVTSLLAPLMASAQIDTTLIKGYSNSIISIINTILVPVLFSIAFLVFLWGVFKYFILGAADEKSRSEGRQFVMWGVIGFVIILSVWGIVALVTGTLGVTAGGSAPALPVFN